MGTGCVTTRESGEESPPDAKEVERVAAFNCHLAERFWEKNRPDLSIRYLENAVRLEPDTPAPRLMILDLHLARGESEAVLQYLDACPEDLQKNPAFLKRRALACELINNGDEAGRLLDEAQAWKLQDRGLISAAAENLLIQGKVPEALELLQDASARYPEQASFLESLIELYETLGRYQEEGENCLHLYFLTEDGGACVRRAARAFARAGCIDEGLEKIARLGRRSGSADKGVIKSSMGYLCYLKGDLERAAFLLEQAFTCEGYEPNHDELLALAEIRMRNSEYRDAAGLLEEHLNRYPDHVLTRAALAWAYHRSGSLELARNVLDGSMDFMGDEGILQTVKERMKREEHGH